MKVSYQNYRQQKQSSKVMRTYIVQAATWRIRSHTSLIIMDGLKTRFRI